MFKHLTSTAIITAAAMVATFATAALPSAAYAATLPVPTVEYSADRTIETEKGNFTGKVYVTRDKQRNEMDMGGMQSVMIIRKDKELGYMLMPAQHLFQQLDLQSAQKQAGGQPQDLVDITEVGSETIEGQSATKYKMIMKDGSAGGFMWITKDGIPVKLDAITKEGNQKSRFTMTLTNIKVGTVDPAVFEVPAGYSAMPSFGGGLFGAKGGLRVPGMGR
jgi:Domain of unknown function (DUF4412)